MKKFAIPTLLAAGFATTGDARIHPITGLEPDSKNTIFGNLGLTHTYTLAGHRSHSSHGSHASHRSSSTGGYTAPKKSTSRNKRSTTPASILPSTQSRAAKSLGGNTEKFKEIARKVQLALTSYGYYNGAIDGVVGKGSKAALSRFQSDYSLKVTGTITPQVLDAFGISAR